MRCLPPSQRQCKVSMFQFLLLFVTGSPENFDSFLRDMFGWVGIGCCDTLQWVGIEQLIGCSSVIVTVFCSSVIVSVLLFVRVVHR
jgi:hypothetical protein